MRPESFDADLAVQWSRWVLDHGLPEVPGSELSVGESVPVAYWIGPSTAAVLHIRRVQDEDDECPLTETDIDLFCLVDGNWKTWGSGGRRLAGRVTAGPVGGGAESRGPRRDEQRCGRGRGCKALWGSVGTEAVMAEVRQASQLTRRPVEAPVGAFVVCGEYAKPFTVRVLNAHGDVLAEVEEPAGFDDESPWS